MIAIVLIAHSPDVGRGLATMLGQTAPNVPVRVAAGTSGGGLGTSAPSVERALRDALEASRGEGAVVLFDLGSGLLAFDIAVEALDAGQRSRIRLSVGPIVEGAILAAIESAGGGTLAGVAAVADTASSAPKIPGP